VKAEILMFNGVAERAPLLDEIAREMGVRARSRCA